MTTTRQIVTRAFSELMYFAEGEDPSAQAMSDGISALNDLLASWRTQGMVIVSAPGFPAGANWRGDWATNTTYAVNDSVQWSGTTYTCSTAHVSSTYDKPGVSPNGATYWTLYPTDDLSHDDDLPIAREFERWIVAILAVEMAPKFNVQPSQLTLRKASDGETALLAAFMPINPVKVDAGLTRMPSQIWPYTIDQVS